VSIVFWKHSTHDRYECLQDWPPQDNFRNVFPELYSAFVDAVPFPDHARPDGVRNLVSFFAQNGVIPDLGLVSSSHGGVTN
jgi:hypothetical protein